MKILITTAKKKKKIQHTNTQEQEQRIKQYTQTSDSKW